MIVFSRKQGKSLGSKIKEEGKAQNKSELGGLNPPSSMLATEWQIL